ncbi:MAG TPA: IS4 family transposase [Chryseolinea sp.]|nr:IS4 family transposase [Chryseolinea sp.]
MSKSSVFTGQPIFSQLLTFVPKSSVEQIASDYGSDRFSRHFTTHAHLITMLYASFNKCESLRELTSGLLAWGQRINHLGIKKWPRRSTISDANGRRSEQVFGKIYEFLYQKNRHLLPDSRKKKRSKLYIADSTTISLFQEVMGTAGRTPANGKRKGGIKVHTLINSAEDVPCMIRMTSAAAHDAPFLKQIQLPKGSWLVFDKGYNDYSQLQTFSEQEITWVTRKRSNAVYTTVERRTLTDVQKEKGIKKDHIITLGHQHHDRNVRVNARLIDFKDPESSKRFQFITNNTKLSPTTIAALYKERWQIEILFRRFKQNYPLTYFLGDCENAIKIQIWCTLIADLLAKIVKALATKKWSFSNLRSIIRIHLMTYIDLYLFLKNPEKALQQDKPPNSSDQQLLFAT